MTETARICKDCRFSASGPSTAAALMAADLPYLECRHPTSEIKVDQSAEGYLVYGALSPTVGKAHWQTCINQRRWPDSCGPEGRDWEPRISWWSRLVAAFTKSNGKKGTDND